MVGERARESDEEENEKYEVGQGRRKMSIKGGSVGAASQEGAFFEYYIVVSFLRVLPFLSSFLGCERLFWALGAKCGRACAWW